MNGEGNPGYGLAYQCRAEPSDERVDVDVDETRGLVTGMDFGSRGAGLAGLLVLCPLERNYSVHTYGSNGERLLE